jgi:predicted dehydrogenase
MVLGFEPDQILTEPQRGETGVDESAVITLCYASGARALLSCSLQFNAPQEALIAGDAGYIRLPHPFYQPDSWLLARANTETAHRFGRKGYGYHFELAEVVRALKAGETESPLAPLNETLALMGLLDRIRAQWDLGYSSKAKTGPERSIDP